MEKGRGVRKQVVQVKGDGGLNWGGRDTEKWTDLRRVSEV